MKRFVLVMIALMLGATAYVGAQNPEDMAAVGQIGDGEQIFTVNQGCYACTPTLDDLREYVRFATNSDAKALERMAGEGRLMVLRGGDKVKIVEDGKDVIKVCTLSGKEVYTFRESINPR